MNEAFPCIPDLDIPETNDFIAMAVPNSDGFKIIVSTGVVDALIDLWHTTMAYSETLPEHEQLNVGKVDQAIDASLTWLMLHELHHFQMGHFKLNGGMALVEGASSSMGLTSRTAHKPSLIDQLPKDQHHLARRCLELQADHDSTEMLLDSYSTDGWDILRFYAASIFAVMVLIDRESVFEDDDLRSYPKAATRIFQFMGYLSVMWMIPAMIKAHKAGLSEPRNEDLPDEEEVAAFQRLVVKPSLCDAALIAKPNGASHILDDIGNIDDFLAYVHSLQNNLDDKTSHLPVGEEYRALLPVNQKLQELLGMTPLGSRTPH